MQVQNSVQSGESRFWQIQGILFTDLLSVYLFRIALPISVMYYPDKYVSTSVLFVC